MSSWIRFDCFNLNLAKGVYDFTPSTGHTYKMMATNTTPLATHTQKSDFTEISTGNGYSGPITLTLDALTESFGIVTVFFETPVLTATSGAISTFQHLVIFDETATNDPVVCYLSLPAGISIPASTSWPSSGYELISQVNGLIRIN